MSFLLSGFFLSIGSIGPKLVVELRVRPGGHLRTPALNSIKMSWSLHTPFLLWRHEHLDLYDSDRHLNAPKYFPDSYQREYPHDKWTAWQLLPLQKMINIWLVIGSVVHDLRIHMGSGVTTKIIRYRVHLRSFPFELIIRLSMEILSPLDLHFLEGIWVVIVWYLWRMFMNVMQRWTEYLFSEEKIDSNVLIQL